MSARIMYGDAEIDAAFDRVHTHYGSTWKVTEVLRQLVREKDREIVEGKTRRDQVAGMRQDIAALTQRVAAIEELVSELVEELKR